MNTSYDNPRNDSRFSTRSRSIKVDGNRSGDLYVGQDDYAYRQDSSRARRSNQDGRAYNDGSPFPSFPESSRGDNQRRPPYDRTARPSYGDDNRSSNYRTGGSGYRNNNYGSRNSDFTDNLKPVRWENEKLTEFHDGEYVEHKEVAQMSDAEVKQLHQQMEVTVQAKGSEVPKPIMRFELAPFPDWVLRDLARQYSKPTPIQSCGWPIALTGRDLVGIAQTGSGKTLAYLLPAIVHVNKQPPLRASDGPIVLVIAPTRELVVQIKKEAARFLGDEQISSIRVANVYGGVPKGLQASQLNAGCHICVATPGRLIDFLDEGTTNLKRVTYLVLDEADRMLEMGFMPQMRAIVSQIRPDRQTLMWSATWPKAIQQLAREFCRMDPVRVTVGSHELQANVCITQRIVVCGVHEKYDTLVNLLVQQQRRSGQQPSKSLIFCETKRGCNVLSMMLQRSMAFPIEAIHGDKEQRERDRVLRAFKRGDVNVLVATDVASRGLDIKNVNYVINYDLPKTIEDYVHRIGRTGRAGNRGTAITIFSDSSCQAEAARMAREIANVMLDAGQTPPPDLAALGQGISGPATEPRWDSRSQQKYSNWQRESSSFEPSRHYRNDYQSSSVSRQDRNYQDSRNSPWKKQCAGGYGEYANSGYSQQYSQSYRN